MNGNSNFKHDIYGNQVRKRPHGHHNKRSKNTTKNETKKKLKSKMHVGNDFECNTEIPTTIMSFSDSFLLREHNAMHKYLFSSFSFLISKHL